jgi:hypothetical protein
MDPTRKPAATRVPQGDTTMRFMILLKGNKTSEAGGLPTQDLLEQMGKYNEEMSRAGVLLSGEGLKPTSQGVRVRFSGAKRIVTEGPFARSRDLIAGFWLIQTKSREEAIEWVKRCPDPFPNSDAEIEIRPLYEASDFGDEFTPELREAEERLRSGLAGRS